jgi:hypothetical protein
MITVTEYFGKWLDHEDATLERQNNAAVLLSKVNLLLEVAVDDGVDLHRNSVTGSQVSGQTYGGFRPMDCPQGSSKSSHKQGRGVDVYDPQNDLDDWLTDAMLEEYELYREHPDDTERWCHLSTRRPPSGKRTFKP